MEKIYYIMAKCHPAIVFLQTLAYHLVQRGI